MRNVKKDVDLNILDEALTAAEKHLRKLLQDYPAYQIVEDFKQHIETHLQVELDQSRRNYANQSATNQSTQRTQRLCV